jgi:phage/plasmid-like protein (TIGR03299 family)
MAHELELIDGVASLALVKDAAWHGLGTIVDHAMTQEEVIRIANLDYEIQLNEVHVGGKLAHGFKGIQRSDTGATFGFVKGKYQTIQNKEAFLFFDEFLDQTDGVYQTAGVLKNGQIAWIQAKLPDHITVNDSDIELYVIVSMYHDGKTACQCAFTPVRVVCNNTLQAATRQMKSRVNILHNSNYSQNLKQAAELMGIKNNYFQQISETFELMAKTKVTRKQADEFVTKIVTGQTKVDSIELSTRSANKIAGILDYYLNHQTQQDIKGTAFGLYNSVTGYYQNVKNYGSAEKKFNNIFISGDAQRDSENAFHYSLMLT